MKKIKLTYSHGNSVANIILNDGKGNVLDSIMMQETLDALSEIGQNRHIKLITFQGEGKHFSFGASVEEHTKDQAPAMLRTFHSIFQTIVGMGTPSMAKISGQCLGGGLELALICNFMFADKSAVLGQPEIVLGVFPPPASVILPLKIGNARAEEILLSGKSIRAEEAERIGLLNRVFDDKTALNAGADDWIAKTIVPKSASSLRYANRAGRVFFNHILSKFLPELENLYVGRLMETEDANEGIRSFLEKRSPVWKDQ